ncbi:hypothetical protein D3C87_1752460 [compost metagenome]
MQDHRLPGIRQYLAVDPFVVLGTFGDTRQGAAGHENDAPVELVYRAVLFVIRLENIIKTTGVICRQLISPAAGINHCMLDVARVFERALDQLQCGRPIETHATLGSVHCLCNA